MFIALAALTMVGSPNGLHEAARNNDVGRIRALATAGAALDARHSESGETPLHSAADAGHAEAITALADAGASLEAQTDGTMALHRAVLFGHTKAILALAVAGASLDAQGSQGITPLHAAAGVGHTEAIYTLVAAGASLEAQEAQGLTPLHTAAGTGQTKAIKALVALGASLEAQSQNGLTPLHVAAMFDGTNRAEELHEELAATGVYALSAPASYAEMITALVAAGASLDAQDDNGETPMHLAASRNHTEAVKALVAAGASLNARNVQGQTPLMLAIDEGHRKVAMVLVEAGGHFIVDFTAEIVTILMPVLIVVCSLIAWCALTLTKASTKVRKPAAASRRLALYKKDQAEQKGPTLAEQQADKRKAAAAQRLPEKVEVSVCPD